MRRVGSLPTHAELATFLETFLPPQANVQDVPYLFHTPRHPLYAPTRQSVSRIVFGVTPTAGFYAALNEANTRNAPAGFLHRPWGLKRTSVPRGSIVIACHQSFDANLTVGWNTALATRLGLRLEDAICIEGYKGNPDRKIGFVARLKQPMKLEALSSAIRGEFAGAGELFWSSKNADGGVDTTIDVIAIMNAFHAEEIERVLSAVSARSWISGGTAPDLLYLTGAAREHGLKAAAEAGIPAFCVGHQACEEWGIRFLADQTRSRWPDLQVVEVLEDDGSPTEKEPNREAV
jgi:putative NIF3 family GTP cyclohydrolase 1 type 2